MGQAWQEPRPKLGDYVVPVPGVDADLFRQVAAALAKNDHRTPRLRWIIRNAGSLPVERAEWLAALKTAED
jgi:hypothetical protein